MRIPYVPSMAEKASHYREKGYAVFPELLGQAEIEPLKSAAARIVEQFDAERYRSVFSTADRDRGRDRYFMESAEAVHCFLEEHAVDESGELTLPPERAINKIGHALHDLVPEFTRFARLPVFREILDALDFHQAQLWQSMYIFKQPRIGGEVRWHQDATYLRARPPGVVGFWVAIEDASRSNGCLWVQPEAHRSPLREIYGRGADGTMQLQTVDDTPWPDQDQAVAVEVPSGSLVIFHDHMPHYSSQNHSDSSRQAYTMHFMDGGSRWLPENWLQRPQLGPFVL